MSVISIGTFDGIHLGHRHLLERVCELARAQRTESVVITYRDHPAISLKKDADIAVLCPAEIKEQELKRLGIGRVVMLDFSPEFAQTSAISFLEDYLVAKWQPEIIVMGYDSHFGKNREGNRDFLLKHSARFGYRVEYVEALCDSDQVISSSRIRRLLRNREVEEANRLLGRHYQLLGTIHHGLAKGRDLGFPTANMRLNNPRQLIPATGLYLSKVHIKEGSFFGLTNIGKSPTVKLNGIIEVETFLIGFDSDLYGSTMQVELIKYLREEKMFASTQLLQQAMHEDLAQAHELIRELEC